MNEFEHRLTTLLHDVASSVNPRSNPDAVFVPTATVVPNDVRVFRPRYLAIAAAGLVFVGGSAFAMERLSGDKPARVTPAAAPESESTNATTTVESTTTLAPVVVATLPAESANRPLIEARKTALGGQVTIVLGDHRSTAANRSVNSGAKTPSN